MKQFQKQTKFSSAPEAIAGEIIDTVPLAMRALRQEIRRRRPSDCSVPGFRVLSFLRRNAGATLSEVAGHIGLMKPTTSKMIDQLVRRGLVQRETSAEDRRCVQLQLSKSGTELVEAARADLRGHLAEMLKPIAKTDRETIARALEMLRELFTPEGASLEKTGESS